MYILYYAEVVALDVHYRGIVMREINIDNLARLPRWEQVLQGKQEPIDFTVIVNWWDSLDLTVQHLSDEKSEERLTQKLADEFYQAIQERNERRVGECVMRGAIPWRSPSQQDSSLLSLVWNRVGVDNVMLAAAIDTMLACHVPVDCLYALKYSLISSDDALRAKIDKLHDFVRKNKPEALKKTIREVAEIVCDQDSTKDKFIQVLSIIVINLSGVTCQGQNGKADQQAIASVLMGGDKQRADKVIQLLDRLYDIYLRGVFAHDNKENLASVINLLSQFEDKDKCINKLAIMRLQQCLAILCSKPDATQEHINEIVVALALTGAPLANIPEVLQDAMGDVFQSVQDTGGNVAFQGMQQKSQSITDDMFLFVRSNAIKQLQVRESTTKPRNSNKVKKLLSACQQSKTLHDLQETIISAVAEGGINAKGNNLADRLFDSLAMALAAEMLQVVHDGFQGGLEKQEIINKLNAIKWPYGVYQERMIDLSGEIKDMIIQSLQATNDKVIIPVDDPDLLAEKPYYFALLVLSDLWQEHHDAADEKSVLDGPGQCHLLVSVAETVDTVPLPELFKITGLSTNADLTIAAGKENIIVQEAKIDDEQDYLAVAQLQMLHGLHNCLNKFDKAQSKLRRQFAWRTGRMWRGATEHIVQPSQHLPLALVCHVADIVCQVADLSALHQELVKAYMAVQVERLRIGAEVRQGAQTACNDLTKCLQQGLSYIETARLFAACECALVLSLENGNDECLRTFKDRMYDEKEVPLKNTLFAIADDICQQVIFECDRNDGIDKINAILSRAHKEHSELQQYIIKLRLTLTDSRNVSTHADAIEMKVVIKDKSVKTANEVTPLLSSNKKTAPSYMAAGMWPVAKDESVPSEVSRDMSRRRVVACQS